MTENEFRKAMHVGICDMCCDTCIHGHDLCDDGVCECTHPRLEGKGMITSINTVCDLWEGMK